MTDQTEAETTNPILALIDKAVEEKTFGLDALTAVQKIKEQVAKLDKDLKNVRYSLEDQKRKTDCVESDNRVMVGRLTGWEKRERLLIEREAKVVELEKQAAVASAVSTTYASVIDKMFANRQFRETIMESGTNNITVPGQSYPSQVPHSRSVTTTREDK